MSNTQKFLEVYKQIEDVATNKYTNGVGYDQGKSFIFDLRREFKFYDHKIGYCANVRNLISHSVGGDFGVEIPDNMIKFLEYILAHLESPKKARQYFIPIAEGKVYTATRDSKVLGVMSQMREHGYTHVPILIDGVVVGVFSANKLFQYMYAMGNKDELVAIDKNTTLDELKDFLSWEQSTNETYEFVGQEDKLFNLQQIVQQHFDNQKHLGMFFVTASGKSTERLLGVLTPWDLISNM